MNAAELATLPVVAPSLVRASTWDDPTIRDWHLGADGRWYDLVTQSRRSPNQLRDIRVLFDAAELLTEGVAS